MRVSNLLLAQYLEYHDSSTTLAAVVIVIGGGQRPPRVTQSLFLLLQPSVRDSTQLLLRLLGNKPEGIRTRLLSRHFHPGAGPSPTPEQLWTVLYLGTVRSGCPPPAATPPLSPGQAGGLSRPHQLLSLSLTVVPSTFHSHGICSCVDGLLPPPERRPQGSCLSCARLQPQPLACCLAHGDPPRLLNK